VGRVDHSSGMFIATNNFTYDVDRLCKIIKYENVLNVTPMKAGYYNREEFYRL
jgi:hypothetical protein